MHDDQGFGILVNGVPRTFRERRDAAYAAAMVIKRRSRNEIVEIIDHANGTKSMVTEDGRLT